MKKSVNLHLYYTAGEAAEVMSRNSHRTVQPFYIRQLARYGYIQAEKFGRSNMYLKTDVDRYIVESRGAKKTRAKQERLEREKQLASA